MSWHHVVAPAFEGAFETAFAPAFEGGSQTRHPERHSRRQARRQARSGIPLKCLAPAAPLSGDCTGDRAPAVRPDPAPPTIGVTGSGLTLVIGGKEKGRRAARSIPSPHGCTLRRAARCEALPAHWCGPKRSGLFAGLALGSACQDRKSTRLNSSHLVISYAVFCLKKKKN